MASATVKQGDTYPPLTTTLTEGPNNNPIDLTTAVSVRMWMKSPSTTVPTVACTITDAANGVVQYAWQAGDTDVPGIYSLEFDITWPSSKRQSVPNDGYEELVIMASLDP